MLKTSSNNNNNNANKIVTNRLIYIYYMYLPIWYNEWSVMHAYILHILHRTIEEMYSVSLTLVANVEQEEKTYFSVSFMDCVRCVCVCVIVVPMPLAVFIIPSEIEWIASIQFLLWAIVVRFSTPSRYFSTMRIDLCVFSVFLWMCSVLIGYKYKYQFDLLKYRWYAVCDYSQPYEYTYYCKSCKRWSNG